MRFVINRISVLVVAAVVFALLAAGAGLLTGAASATVGPDASFPCNSTSPCVTAVNSGSGAGLRGSGKKGPGVFGTSTSGFGLEGQSSSGVAIYGKSSSNYGVEAISGTNSALRALNTSTGIGVSAAATNGIALFATTSNGTAIYGVTANGFGAQVTGTTLGLAATSVTSGGTGVDAWAFSGTGAYIHSDNGDGALIAGLSGNGAVIEGLDGVVARAPAGTGNFPIIATDLSANDVFYVDGNGNVFYHGGLNHFAKTRGGREAMAFGSNATTPSLEDVGSAKLVNGQAIVPLDSTFAQAIDPRSPYHVFLTPDGDTRGLYVASKGPDSFVVRETQNGRSTLSFDYRIVATALGHTGERMVLVSSSRGPRVPRTILRGVPAPKAHIVGTRTTSSR